MFLLKLCRICRKFKIDKASITTGRDKKNYKEYLTNKMVCNCGN